MKSLRPLLVLAAAAVLLVVVLSNLFQLRLARDLYPPYSTLRADPLGLRALHDSLAALPEFTVQRWTRPIERLPATPPQTIYLVGAWADQFDEVESDVFNALEATVRAGSRLVIVCRAERNENIADREEFERLRREFRESREGKKAKPASKDEKPGSPAKSRRVERDPDATPTGGGAIETVVLPRLWGFEIAHRKLVDREVGAVREAGAPSKLPATLGWKSDRYLKLNAGMGWKTIYRRAGETVLAEMPLGRGTVVLGTDAFFLSNEALQRERATGLLAWTIGAQTRVLFLETHLGVAEETGVAALARRYGLAPAGGLLLLLAVLFVWRRAALFVPPPPEAPEVGLDYHPTAGLSALLRRALPPAQLIPTSLAEWKKTAARGEVARVETLVAAAPPKEHPVATYNRIVAALRRR